MKNFMVHYTVDSSQKLGLNFDNILIAEINLYLILFKPLFFYNILV